MRNLYVLMICYFTDNVRGILENYGIYFISSAITVVELKNGRGVTLISAITVVEFIISYMTICIVFLAELVHHVTSSSDIYAKPSRNEISHNLAISTKIGID